MKTVHEATDWAVRNLGKTLEWGGYSQCVAFIRWYIRYLGYEQPAGVAGAKDLWRSNWSDNFEKVSDPKPGDIVIFDGTSSNRWGHVAIVVSVERGLINTIDQNYVNAKLGGNHGSPIARVRHGTANVFGYVRPKLQEKAPALISRDTYTIKKGDTFWDLERAMSWKNGTLTKLNPGVDPRALAVGQRIKVPNAVKESAAPPQARTHTVQRGDNLYAIGQRYGVSYNKIYQANRGIIGNNPNIIHVGQKLVIPR